MKNLSRQTWTYLGSGLIMLIVSSSVTGCRFGNRIERQESADKMTGYYETAPQSLLLCAMTATENCANAQINQTPYEIASIMSNPVIFGMVDEKEGLAIFANAFGKSDQMPIYFAQKVDESQQPVPGVFDLLFLGSTRTQVLWSDPACTVKTYYKEKGTLDQNTAHIANGVQLAGSLDLEFQAITAFEGTCTTSLQSVSDCYSDANFCGGNSDAENQAYQAQYQELFNPYINAGVMTVNDIPSTVQIGYKVSYE